MRPGGVLVNGDHLPPDETAPAAIAAHVGRRRAERQRAYAHEDWDVLVGRRGPTRNWPT